MDEYDGRQYVGIDLHKRRSVIVRMTPDGQRLGPSVRIDNDSFELAQQVASWGEAPEVVLEATYGWVLGRRRADRRRRACPPRASVGSQGIRVQTGEERRTGRIRSGRFVADGSATRGMDRSTEVRGLREAVRHRCKLVALRSGLKAQVHAVLARQGVMLPMSDIFDTGGRKALAEQRLDPPFHARVLSLLRLIDSFDFEIDVVTKRVTAKLNHDRGYRAIQAIPGVGPVLAAVFVAEIGDVTRFPRPQQLCSWAGMTPKHRESDTKVHRGRITKQGNHLVRWAAVEAIQRVHLGPLASKKAKLSVKRGNNIAKVAAARELLSLVFYGLRDGHIRCLSRTAAPA